jgi:long-subunit acyl-CoA synthetase (AMP-forming)
MPIDERYTGSVFCPHDIQSVDSIHDFGCRTKHNDEAMIYYTSRTTRQPKGAIITHRNLVENVEELLTVWRVSAKDILLYTLPLFHALS